MDTKSTVYLFFSYAFLGFIWEMIWVGLTTKNFNKRGFLKGPVLPIYGFGSVFITMFVNWKIKRYSDLILVIFISGLFIATLLEFITGYIIEKIFKVRYWDYEKRPFNFKGYICLRSSLFFGIMSIFLVRYLNNWLFKLDIYHFFRNNLILIILISILIFDTMISIREAYSFKQILDLEVKIDDYIKDKRKELNVFKTKELEKLNEKLLSKERFLNQEIKYLNSKNYTAIISDLCDKKITREKKVKDIIIKKVNSKDIDVKQKMKIKQKIDKIYNKRIYRIRKNKARINKVLRRNEIKIKGKK
ncbi:MAG: putative ABC transporter permease [Tissierellia bacterium]|nr:putative ABC transporter permease [Tissierellia bacterium]